MSPDPNDIAAELPKATDLLSELTKNASVVCNTLKNLTSRINEGTLNTEEGLSLLELKNQTFLSYLSNLSYTSLLKLSGISLDGHFSVDNLVDLRVTLERIRPLEDKLKYQIQKYLKADSENVSAEVETPKNAVEDMEGFSDDDEASSTSHKDVKLYKIPRISQVHYPGEEEKDDHRQKRERMRALSSAMVRDALEEHAEDPEVHHNNANLKPKAVKKMKEIERYEEENFTRITLTKKQKASMKQIDTAGTINADLLSFRKLDFFDGYEESSGLAGGKKRKRPKSKSKKFKKKKKH